MLILYAIFWFTVASSHPFSSSISWYDAEIDMSNIDVVITLTNGSTPYYGIVVNTEADVHISNMAITLPNSTVINTGPMISYISTYHQDIYDIIMPAAGFTEDFIKSLGNNDGQIIKVKLQPNNTITQSLGPLLAPTDDDDDYESDPERDFASDSDEIIESNMNSTPIPIYYHPSYKS